MYSMLNESDPENCNSEISLGWIYVRTVWNLISIVINFMLMVLLYKMPNLLFGCFDKLYMCTFIADLLANIARVLLKYFPIIFCNLHFIILLERQIPLASIVNGIEWYLAFVMIVSAFFFNIDRTVLVISPRNYPWICNDVVKWTLVSFVWIVPVLWVLPMFGDCCRSVYLTEGSPPVFIDSDVESIYDTIDMLLEAMIYLPVIFSCNCVSIVVLHYRYIELQKRHNIEIQNMMKKKEQIWKTDSSLQINVLPKLEELKELYNVGDKDSVYLRIHRRRRKRNDFFVRKRIMAEFDMAIVTLIDQMLDAVGIFFYLLFWGGNNGWIDVDVEDVLFNYDVTWELGTTCQAFILMIICPERSTVRLSLADSVAWSFLSLKTRNATVTAEGKTGNCITVD